MLSGLLIGALLTDYPATWNAGVASCGLGLALVGLTWTRPRVRLGFLSVMTLVGIATAVPLLTITSPLKGPAEIVGLIPRSDPAVVNANTLGLLLMPAASFAAASAIAAVTCQLRISWAVATAVAAGAIVTTGSHTAILATVVGAAGLLLVVKAWRVITVGLALFVVTIVGLSTSSSTVRDDLAGRVMIWDGIIRAYLEGKLEPSYGAFAYLQQTSPQVVLYGWVLPFNAHNTYLQQFADFGAIGLVGLLVLGATSVRAALAACSSEDRVERTIGHAAFSGLIAAATAGFAESLLTTTVVTTGAVVTVMSPTAALLLLAPLGLRSPHRHPAPGSRGSPHHYTPAEMDANNASTDTA